MKKTTQNLYKGRLLQVLVFIQQNLDGNLSLDVLAKVAHFSAYHFHRIFRGLTGESLQEHIRRLRLERAAMRLKHSDDSVLDIATEAGYETNESFTRAFKALCGYSPSCFRSNKGVLFKTGRTRVPYNKTGLIKSIKLPKGGKPVDVKIEKLEPMRVAFVRHVGPYNEVSTAWDNLCTWLGKEGLLGPDSKFIGLCYDDPDVTAPEKIRYDACVTVGENFEAINDIGVQTIPGGEFAIVTHIGPYNKLGKTYAKLFGRWLPQSGRELRSQPCLEFYLNDPQSTEPAELLTDIYVPLEPLL
jgi:AraC family transcriptional regulator